MALQNLKINVRFAERKDCPAIMNLKEATGIQQNQKDRPLLTHQELERDGFDKKPPCFRCIVAECEEILENGDERKSIVGYALYYHAYSAWEGKTIHLEDFSVTSKLRAQGLGELILRKLAKIGVEENFARIQFEVFAWNERAIKFYKRFGGIDFTEKEGWVNFCFNSDAIKKLAQ